MSIPIATCRVKLVMALIAIIGCSFGGQVDANETNPIEIYPASNDVLQGAPESRGSATERTLDEAIQTARRGQAALDKLEDYTAVFDKRELVGGRLLEQTMDMKCRQHPFSVYFRYRSRKEAGREVLFVEGANAGHLLVRERGLKSLAGTLRLKPDALEVMEENRYAITEVGIAKVVEKSLRIWAQELRRDAGNVIVRSVPDARVGRMECEEWRLWRREKRPGFEYRLSRVFFEKTTGLPVHVEQYGWPARNHEAPPLLEEYTYSELRTNVGLTDADFDPQNSAYGFGASRLRPSGMRRKAEATDESNVSASGTLSTQ